MLLFLLLQAVALFLVVRFNDPQRHAVGDQLLEVNASIQQRRYGLNAYFSLKEGNVQLQHENDSLRMLLDEFRSRLDVAQALIERDSIKIGLVDSLKSQETFSYIPTQAIRFSYDLSRNYITLDKGSNQGVTENMGLISPQGVAGFVIKTSPNFSLALSVISNGVGIGAKIEDLSIRPTFMWGGKDPALGTLKWIPLDVELKQGMKVYTSGIQSRFPAGFMIGEIVSLSENTQVGFYDVQVRLSTDFRSLYKLYLVSLDHKIEINALQEDLKQ